MKIMITGANGHLGRLVLGFLEKEIPVSKIAVSVRKPGKAKDLMDRGIEVRQGDFDDPEGLEKTFQGIDRLLIISADGDNETRIRQHLAAVGAAKKAGVGFIAYTSVVDAKNSGLFLADVHKATEEAIEATGIPYTILRNNWYLENELSSIQASLGGAPWITSAGDGKVGWLLRRDYAEAAAAVLIKEGQGHYKKVYEITGRPYTQEELVKVVNQISGTSIKVINMTDDEYAKTLKKVGVIEAIIPMLLAISKGIRQGFLNIESSDFEAVTGHSPTPLDESLKLLLADK